MKKLNQRGFVPMILFLVALIIMSVIFVYLRVKKAN
jgi:hypothetical protein